MKQISTLAAAFLLAMGLAAAPAFAGHHEINPCNPCAMKHNPCNPCSMKKDMKDHNPCSMKGHKMNPCSMKGEMEHKMNPCSM